MAVCNCLEALQGNAPLWTLYDLTEDNCEVKLYDSLIMEFTDIAGFPIEYYINIANYDQLYGEDPNNRFADPALTKLIYEPSEETTILNQFGITSDETLQFALIPKSIFIRDLTSAYNTIDPDLVIIPKPGDVIKTLWNNRNYELADVNAEQQIFSARKLVWAFILRPFRFSEQSDSHFEIHTGIDPDIMPPLSATDYIKDHSESNYGDNTWVEDNSDDIDDYDDVDTKIFGY